MECRERCGACCVAPSIKTPIPGMPEGKPAGVRCVQLDADDRCLLYGRPERPAFCASLRPSEEMCGRSKEEAHAGLVRLERLTAPASQAQTETASEVEGETGSAGLPDGAD